MPFGLFAEYRGGGRVLEVIGAWVVSCDVDARDGLGSFVLTRNRNEARQFETATEAMLYWQRPSTIRPVREDGKPNRPLTAFTVAVQPLENIGEPPSYRCPRCGAVSFNPHDLKQRYCGRCHQFENP
jgi:hypothetical protein